MLISQYETKSASRAYLFLLAALGMTAFALFFLSTVLPYPVVWQASCFALTVVAILLANRLYFRRFLYQIRMESSEDEDGTISRSYWLTVMEKQKMICRINLQDARLLIPCTPERKPDLDKAKEGFHALSYSYASFGAGEPRYCLVVDDTYDNSADLLLLYLSPDDAFLQSLKQHMPFQTIFPGD